jgi:CIC family chloride channel protein
VLRRARRTITGTLGTALIAIVAAMVADRCVAGLQWVIEWPSDDDRWWSIVMVAGVVVSLAIVQRARTTGETTRAFRRARDDPRGDLRPVPARMAATATGVGLGAPLGLDGPALHLGGALGGAAARLLRRNERAWTIATGVAALSMVIDAPVAAALFAIEIGGRRAPRGRDVPAFVVGSAAGWLVRRLMGQRGGVLAPASELTLQSVALAGLIIGLTCGMTGGLLAQMLHRAQTLRSSLGRRLTIALVALGSAVPIGWTATGHGIFIGSGDRILGWARSSSALPVSAALVVSVVLVLALVAADLVGGLLVPLLTLGGLIGLILAKSFLPSAPTAFVIVVGGCALLAVAHRTPATAIALAWAAFGWSAASWAAVLAVIVAVVASGMPIVARDGPSGQHVHS